MNPSGTPGVQCLALVDGELQVPLPKALDVLMTSQIGFVLVRPSTFQPSLLN